MPEDLQELPVDFRRGDAKLERISRLDCEHRDVLDDGSLDPCSNPAAFAVTTADYGAPTRTRYCSVHLWDAITGWIERGDDDD